MKPERRIGAELRATGGGDAEPTRIVGHAAVFEQRSEDLGGFVEQIAPGAFAESIDRDDVRALINHDANLVLGRNRAGTLTLDEDATGLYFEIAPPATSYARDLVESIGRGDVSQNSFGFMVAEGGDKWTDVDGATPLRTLTRVTLLDVSPVTYPAYPQTDVALRTLAQLRQPARDPAQAAAMAEHRRRLARARLEAARRS